MINVAICWKYVILWLLSILAGEAGLCGDEMHFEIPCGNDIRVLLGFGFTNSISEALIINHVDKSRWPYQKQYRPNRLLASQGYIISPIARSR
jgi:hypothetical protein